MSKSNQIMVLGAMLLLLPMSALAYLDPGTGSLLLQALIGAIAAVVATIGIYRDKMKNLLRKWCRRGSDESTKGE